MAHRNSLASLIKTDFAQQTLALLNDFVTTTLYVRVLLHKEKKLNWALFAVSLVSRQSCPYT